MRSYDLVYVIRPDLETDAVQAAIDRMTTRIKEQGGTVEAVDVWGKKRMAFTIRKHRDGVFVHTRFALDTNKLDEIRRAAALSEDLLRATVTTAVGPTPQPKSTPTPAAGPEPSRGAVPVPVSGPEPDRGTETPREPAPDAAPEAKG